MNPKFNIYTGLLKAYRGPDGKARLRTTASSTITDLGGDEILPPAIEQMAAKARDNMTIFLNHEYRVPEDVLGSVEDTSMATRGVDSDGNPIVDLDFDIRVNESNPRALQTFASIEAGTKLGTSIGAIVRHATKKKGGGLRIDDVELLEASIVGIPANPRSWVHYAAKAITKDPQFLTLSSSNAIPDEDLPEVVIEDELDPTLKEADVIETIPETEDLATKNVEEEIDTKATCPSCKKDSGACDCTDCDCKKDAEPVIEKTAELEATADPDKEASRTQVTVTVDSDAAQDAPKSTPEAAVMDEDRADVTSDADTAALGDTVTRDASDVVDLVKRLSDFGKQVGDLQKALTDERTAHKETKENLSAALQIFERIADLPIGRKTHFTKAVTDYRKRFPQYDEEFIKLLEKD